MNPEYQINREQFEAWLFSQPDERVFNYFQSFPNDQPGCLLCNFFRENCSEPIIVGEDYYLQKGVKYSLPTWFMTVDLEALSVVFNADQAKKLYLAQFPNAIVGNNDTATNVASLSFNSIASVTESNATNKLNSPSKQTK